MSGMEMRSHDAGGRIVAGRAAQGRAAGGTSGHGGDGAARGAGARGGQGSARRDATWTIGKMLRWTTDYLTRKGDEHPRLSAEWLINNVTGLSRVQIYMSFDRELTPGELNAMHDAVVRRAKGEPLQYVTGEMPFRHIVLRCERGVLIPRPETEILVDAALEGVDAAVAAGATYDDVRKRQLERHQAKVDGQAKAGAAADHAAGSTGDSEVSYGRPLGSPLSTFAGDASHDAASESDTTGEKFDPIVAVAGPEQSRVPQYIPGPEDNAALVGQGVGAAGAANAIAAGMAVSAGFSGVAGGAGAEAVSAEGGEEASDSEDLLAQKLAPNGVRVLEVGCGTGCIALSIASERPGTHVVTTDLSEQAVALAARNRNALGLDDAVDICRCDLAAGVDPQLMGTFAVLVSNPPYIPSSVVPTLPQEVVGYEPGLALDGGPDGLDVFRRLLDLAPRALAPGGMLCCELFETNVSTAAELVRKQGGWAFAEVREDLTHRPRVLVARREG